MGEHRRGTGRRWDAYDVALLATMTLLVASAVTGWWLGGVMAG